MTCADPPEARDRPAGKVLTALLAMQRQSWEQGVAGHAALDLGLAELAVLFADAAVTRQAADGRLGSEGETGAVNGAACAEVVAFAARTTGEPRWADALRRQLDWLVDGCPRAADGTLFHLLGGRQVWVDTVYMVLPPLAAAGRADLAVRQLDGHRRRLYDERSGLYAARWDEDAGVLSRDWRWGTGNGWVVAGIARALRGSPELPPDVRQAWAAHARAVIEACLAHRRADGAFHDVLDDPGTFREVNVAQMLAYATLVGAADGWLPEEFDAVGRDLLATATAGIDARGLVTGVCGAPDFEHPGTSAEAQAFHLLAHAASDAAGAAGDAASEAAPQRRTPPAAPG